MEYRTTKDGDEIPIDKLSDSHLVNIYNMICRVVKEGIKVQYGGGLDAEDMRYDEEIIYGEEVWEYNETYIAIRKEYNKRFGKSF